MIQVASLIKCSASLTEWVGTSVGDIAVVKVENDRNVESTRCI